MFNLQKSVTVAVAEKEEKKMPRRHLTSSGGRIGKTKFGGQGGPAGEMQHWTEAGKQERTPPHTPEVKTGGHGRSSERGQ